MSDDDIVTQIIDQMYDSDWFSRTPWWIGKKYQTTIKHGTGANNWGARKWYMEAKGQKQEHANKIAEADLQLYLTAIEAKAQQDTKNSTNENTSLLALVQEQQKNQHQCVPA